MATDDALSGDRVTIWFAPVDSVGSDLATDGVKFQSFISNFSESGGEKQIDTVNTFSDTGIHGAISIKKPRDQKELSFDVVLRHGDKIVDFKKIERGENVVGASVDQPVGMIVVQNTDGVGNYYYQAYNNVDAVVFDTEFSAEEEWKGSLKFKLNVADPNGVYNLQEDDDDVTTSLTSWS